MSFNPYVPFQRQLAEVNFMAGGATFQAVLTLYQCLLGISILLILGSLWIRLTKARESVWLVRMSRGLVRPNYIFAALGASFIFIVLELFCIQSIRKYGYIDNADRRDAVLFRTLRYIPLFIGAWILTWTTVLEANSISTADRRFDLENHALLVNTFFFSVPILFVVLLVTFDVIADRYWVQVLVIYAQLKIDLDLASSNFDKGISADIVSLQILQQALTAKVEVMTFWWQKANATLAAFILILLVAFTIASFLYFRNLEQSIRSIREISNPGLDSSKRLAALQNVFRSLLATTVVVELIAVTLLIPSFYITASLGELGVDPVKATMVNLWTMGVYSILGLLLNAALFYRSLALLRAQKNAEASSQPPSQSSGKTTLVAFSTGSRKLTKQSPNRSNLVSLELDSLPTSPTSPNNFEINREKLSFEAEDDYHAR